MDLLNNALAIAMVVLGLGFVIFIHELGHFLLAKWNGVKVEKFAIGFDVFNWKLWSKTVGETTYVVGALPLGGYVKMLGEEASEAKLEDVNKDPRAYHNKPVGARMAIISAGVIMNILFGWACFTYVYLRGKPEVPPIIGGVVAGMPAYDAGIRTGDRVLRIDGRPIVSYSELQQATIFTGKGERLRLELERPGHPGPVNVELAPKLKDGAMVPTLGITAVDDLELLPKGNAFVPPAGFSGDPASIRAALKEGGRVIAAGGLEGPLTAVKNKYEFDRVLAAHIGTPMRFEVQSPASGGSRKVPNQTYLVTIPPSHIVDLGLRMTQGPIAGLQNDSPAARAGLNIGDRLLSVDGLSDFDPMRLPDLIHARAGQSIVLEVERPVASASGPAQRITLTVEPDDTPPWVESVFPDELLEIPGLGVGITIEPKVASVVPGSPADSAGIKAGDVLRAVELVQEVTDRKAPKSQQPAKKKQTLRYVLDGKLTHKDDFRASWPATFDAMQQLPRHEIVIRLAGSDREFRLTPEPVEDWFYPQRGLRFNFLMQPLPPQPLLSALGRAWKDTQDNALSVYYIIRGLIQQTLPKDAVGGPGRIAVWAYDTARIGPDAFIPFLGMLSINLAVVNFLPIPPLDGGQMLFLICEKIRGRPLPERLAGPVMIAGLLFILLIFLAVNVNDVMSFLGPPR